MSIRNCRKGSLSPLDIEEILRFSDELVKIWSTDNSYNIKERPVGDMWDVPKRSVYPYLIDALKKGDAEFNMLFESIISGTFEFPLETNREYEVRMMRRVLTLRV